ncbi:MAG: glycosyltransferase family 2 protein [Pyrinomonadaceae bacterium]
MSTKISVIIPTYNRADLVVGTIESVLTQSLDDFEVIVADDGSNDNTKEVLSKYLADERFQYCFQSNHGRSAARNLGMHNASGEYLMFLDSDDLLFSNALEMLYNAAKAAPDAGLIAGSRIFIDPFGNRLETVDPVKVDREIWGEKIHVRKIRELFFPPSTYIVKRALALEVDGYDDRMESAEDFDFFIKCCDSAPITVLTEPVVRMRRHEGNTPDRSVREAVLRISKNNLERLENEPRADEIGQIERIRAEWLVRMADDSYCLNRNSDSLKYNVRAVAASPRYLFDAHVVRQIAASLVPIFLRNGIKRLFLRNSRA